MDREDKKYIDSGLLGYSKEDLNESKQDELNFRNWLNDEELANKFFKYRQSFKAPENDYYYWIKKKDPKELLVFIKDYESNKQSKEEKHKEVMQGAEFLGEENGYKVYHITTWEASKTLGQGAQWCISMKNDSRYWKSYTEKGIKFYFFISSSTKYALALYPKVLEVNKFIDKDTYLIKANLEIYNAEDSLDYYTVKNLPINLIPEEVVLEYFEAENGLFLSEDKKTILRVSKDIKECVIPNSVTEIGECTFFRCRSLESVTVPNSVIKIGDSAFGFCTSLKSITIPNSVIKIGVFAFRGCDSLIIDTDNEYVKEYCRNWMIPYISINNKEESLVNEDIEKHAELNPLLFENNELKEEIADKLEEIAMSFIDDLEEEEIEVKLKDIVLIGSNANYNYTKDSDIDLHLILDSEELSDKKLYNKIYDLERSIFNKNYSITVKGIPVEIYVELDEPKGVSGGVYSLFTGWLKEPVQKEIPDIDEEEFEKLFSEWEDKYFELLAEREYPLDESLLKTKSEDTLVEYSKSLKNQGYENDKLKNQLRKLADENNLELVSRDNLTVHHLDDTIDSTIKKYANNNIDNVLFVDVSTIDANAFHQILHYCKNNKKRGWFSLIRTIKQMLDIPVYWVDSNQNIHKLSFRQAFKKVTEKLEEVLKEDLQEDTLETDNEGNTLNKEQIEFFKNSKIRNTKGELVICYHSTNADFDIFDSGKLGEHGNLFGDGFYFSTHSDNIYSYGSKYKTCYLNITKPYNITKDNSNEELAKELIKNYCGDFDEEFYNKIYSFDPLGVESNVLRYIQLKTKEKTTFTKVLKASKYDGVIADNLGDIESRYAEIVAFYPNQIKSITNKNPTNSKNINEDIIQNVSEYPYTDETSPSYVITTDEELLRFFKEHESWEQFKVVYDPKQDIYIVGDPFEKVHIYLLYDARDNGWYDFKSIESKEGINIIDRCTHFYVNFDNDSIEDYRYKIVKPYKDLTLYIYGDSKSKVDNLPFLKLLK